MSANNELDWEDYEALTQYIYGALGMQYGIKVIGYGRNCKIKGQSGVQHQIDVLTEQFEGERRVLTAIECKYAKKKVDKDIVMKLSQIMQDSGIASGIIVCKSGFTRDAKMFAAHHDVKLVELREAEEIDEDFKKTMEVGTFDINLGITGSRVNVASIDFGNCMVIISDQSDYLYMYYTHLQDAKKRTVSFDTFLKAFAEEVNSQGQLLKTITKDFPITEKLFWTLPDKKIVVEKIVITGFLINVDMSTKKSFQLTDQVWLIMTKLFDGRRLTMSRSGLIWNLP